MSRVSFKQEDSWCRRLGSHGRDWGEGSRERMGLGLGWTERWEHAVVVGKKGVGMRKAPGGLPHD